MAKLIQKKLPASTLPEVIISMVIIMAVFVVAIGIYVKVTQSGLSMSKTWAQQRMKSILMESIKNKDLEDAVLNLDSVEFKKSVTAYAGYADILLITIQANQHGKNVGSLQQLIKK
jgi:hypothetical protein